MLRTRSMLRTWSLLAVVSLALAVAFAAACGDSAEGDAGAVTDVTIVPLASTTPRGSVAVTGKGGQPPRTATAAPAAVPTDEPPPTEAPPIASIATSTTEPAPTSPPAAPPTTGRWIDVDVANYAVRLMDGETVQREIAPVGVGVAIDTGAYISTQTGLFYVHSKAEALVYDAPFGTYISHWVGFDPEKDNGFHSFLKDAAGAVVDASTGRVSNGCIRTGEPEAIFAFAEIGMPVFVHW